MVLQWDACMKDVHDANTNYTGFTWDFQPKSPLEPHRYPFLFKIQWFKKKKNTQINRKA